MEASHAAQEQHKHPFIIKKKRHTGRYIIAFAAIIVLAAIAFELAQAMSIYSVTSNRTLSVATNRSVYLSLGNGKELSLFVLQSSSSSAVVYLTPVPVLGSQIMEFVTYPASLVNVSSTYSGNADLQFKLLSSTPASATFEITKIPSSFDVKVSGDVFFVNATVRKSITSARNSSVVASTTVASTTSTTTTGSSSSSTTTATGMPVQQIMSAVNKTNIGILMGNYSTLYARDKACTASDYNTTFQQQKHSTPSAGSAYYNVTATVPTSISTNITRISGGNFSIVYVAHAPSAQFSGSIVNVALNLSASNVKSVGYIGNWAGLNYTAILAEFNYENGISGNCGAYIP